MIPVTPEELKLKIRAWPVEVRTGDVAVGLPEADSGLVAQVECWSAGDDQAEGPPLTRAQVDAICVALWQRTQ